MKILIGGASGLIGTALTEKFKSDGLEVVKMVRDHDLLTDRTAYWDPMRDVSDTPKLEWISGGEGFRAVINLAGENLAKGKWTDEYKQRIRDSRLNSTTLMANALTQLSTKPRVYINASAIGYYGNRGEEHLDETSAPGTDGFLTALTKKWEAATIPASDAGIRTVMARFGIVLSAKGGALQKMISMAKVGGAAPVGEGTQWWSWITIDDAVEALVHIIKNEKLSGPVNIVNSNPMRNEDFSRSRQFYFKAPITMHGPKFMLNLTLGEMAEETLLASQKVMPVKLRGAGFKFKHTSLEPALRHLTSVRIKDSDIERELGQ